MGRRNESDVRKIKAKLIEMGIMQRHIADALNINRATVSHVITGDCKSERIENFLIGCGIPECLLKDSSKEKRLGD